MPEPIAPAPADNQPKEQTLEELTNEVYGQEGVPQLNTVRESQESVTPEAEPASAEGTPVVADPTPAVSGQVSPDDLKLLEDIRAISEVSGTPFKSVPDLIKAHKELQSQWTKDHDVVTRVKPYEQLLSDMNDPNFANFLQQAAVLYKNPSLAASYINPTGQINTPPDPRSYNMFEDQDLQRYQKDQTDYMNRQLDSRINARFAASEGQTKTDKMKSDLRTAFPESNPDDLLQWVGKRGNDWSLIDAYKIREFDNIKTKAMEDARKELNQKMETATRTTTPAPSASPKGNVKVEDIISHISRYGGDSARKKFGDKNYLEALRDSADAV